jgi:aspartate/methionine/tyrosine aminotransferase
VQTLRANPHIALLIFNDPVNPSGVKFSREELLEIGSVLDQPEFRHIFILIDDTYHELCYGESVRRRCVGKRQIDSILKVFISIALIFLLPRIFPSFSRDSLSTC